MTSLTSTEQIRDRGRTLRRRARRPVSDIGSANLPFIGLSWVRITRLENCGLAAACVAVGYSASGRIEVFSAWVPGAVACSLVLAAGNVFNDIVDRDVDSISKPERPIPSGRIAIRSAASLLVVLLAISLGLGTQLPGQAAVLLVAMVLTSLVYSTHLKRLPLLGNVTYSVQCGLVIIFGALLARSVSANVGLAAALVAGGVLLVELGKTIEDGSADGLVGYRTIAHVLSSDALRTFACALVGAYIVGCGALLWLTGAYWLLSVLMVAPMLPFVRLVASWRHQPVVTGAARSVRLSKPLWPLMLIGLALVLT